MTRSIRTRQGFRGNGAARQFYARERRKSLLDPAFKLFGSHNFGVSPADIDTGAHFLDRDRAVTFSFSIKRTTASPNGVILELGDATTGLAVWIENMTLGFAVGEGTGDDGLTLSHTATFLGMDQQHDIVVSCIPGRAAVCIWDQGKIIGSGRTASGSMPNGWSSGAAGSIGRVNGAFTPRIPTPQAVDLVGVNIVRPVKFYDGQFPQQFAVHTIAPPVTPPTPGGAFGSGFDNSFDIS